MPQRPRISRARKIVHPGTEERSARAIILVRDRDTERTRQYSAEDQLTSVPFAADRHWRVAGSDLVVVHRRADAYSLSVDRSTDNRSAYAATLSGLDSRHVLPQTIQVHSAQPNLAGSSARSDCCRGYSFLPASWV